MTKELRIGNLVRDNISKTELKVVELTENHITTYVIDREMFPLKDGWGIEPIPLTEEWLVNLGFDECYKTKNKQGILKQYSKSRIKFDVSNSGNIYYSHKNIPIYHVHQLQNLYHALTQQELTNKN